MLPVLGVAGGLPQRAGSYGGSGAGRKRGAPPHVSLPAIVAFRMLTLGQPSQSADRSRAAPPAGRPPHPRPGSFRPTLPERKHP